MRIIEKEDVQKLESKFNSSTLKSTCVLDYIKDNQDKVLDHLKNNNEYTTVQAFNESGSDNILEWITISDWIEDKDHYYDVVAKLFNYNKIMNNDFWYALEEDY